MTQRDQIPEEVMDKELYLLHLNALNDSELEVRNADFDDSNIGRYTTQFDDLNVVQRKAFINIESSQGLSKLRDVTETSNGGTITSNGTTGEIELNTDTQPDSYANIETARWGQYTPGYEAEIGLGARLPQQPTDDGVIRWGYFNGRNGFYFGYDSGGLFVALRRNRNIKKKVYRENWNGRDPDDVEGVTFDPKNGGIYQINYAWYGYGSIQFTIVSSSEDNPQKNVVVHSFKTDGETSISNPNQPVRMSIDAGTSGNSIEAYLGGRQFSILGDITDNFRISSETLTQQSVDDGSWTHVASIRRKLNDERRTNMLIDGFEINADDSVRVALTVDADISGTNYGTYSLIPQDETISEISSDGTFNGIGEGTKAIESYLPVGQNSKSGVGEPIRELNQPIPRNKPLTLLARGEGGTANVDVTMRVREQW